MVKLTGKREIFGDIPLLFSGNPGRVDPSHIANGFVTKALGVGGAGKKALAWMHGDSNDQLGTLLSSSTFEVNKQGFRKILREAILDPDHCTFPSGGSAFPIHPVFATHDPSDDGYGGVLWKLVCAYYQDPTEDLRTFLTPQSADPISRLIRVLVAHSDNDSSDSTGGYLPDATWGWQEAGKLGDAFGGKLAEIIVSSFVEDSSSPPSVTVPRFVSTLYLSTYLGALRSPVLVGEQPDRWSKLAPMFIYGGVPPGEQKGWPERLAAKSFQVVLSEHRRALESLLAGHLDERIRRLPKSAKGKRRNHLLLHSAFTHAKKTVIDQAVREVGTVRTVDSLTQRLMDAVYPYGHLEKGARQFGRKLGFAGPERGGGSPRFMLETPTIGLLVDLTLSGDDAITFDDWLRRLYDQFGIVIGWVRDLDTVALLADLGSVGLLHEALDSNRELFRSRMVRAGLAVEYSDGETEVIRHESGAIWQK